MKMVLTLLLMVLIAWAGLTVRGVADAKIVIVTNPEASHVVVYRGVEMSRAQFEVMTLEQQNGPVQHWLIQQSDGVLWSILYVLAGIAGGIAAIWLEMAGFTAASRVGAAPRLAVAAVAGWITFLLLRLPAPLVGSFFAPTVATPRGDAAATHEALASLAVIGVLGGLFASVFFERLRGWYEAKILSREGGEE